MYIPPDRIDFRTGINISALERKEEYARATEAARRDTDLAIKQWELENYGKALDYSWPPKTTKDADAEPYPAYLSEPLTSSPRFVYRKRTSSRKLTN